MSNKKISNTDEHDELLEAVQMAQKDFSSMRTTMIEIVLRAIRDAIERVKISLILPKLIENRQVLVKVLSNTQYKAAIKLVDDFFRRRDIILREHRSPLMDHGMIKIIDFFQINREMYKLFPTFMSDLTINERKVLTAFEMLIDMSERHLKRDSKSQIQEERRLQKLYKEHLTLQDSIDDIKGKIASRMTRKKWKLAGRAVYLQKCERELEQKKQEDEESIINESEKCRRTLRMNQKVFLDKQAELQEELDTARNHYLKLVSDNKIMEKHAREEKNKLELQLQGIIKKYDSTIGEKMIEHLELQDQLKESKDELKKIMVVFRKEEAIYKQIVVKREKEEERKKAESILKYSMNRAAAKIQRFWRKWRKDQKRKNKRLRKSMMQI